MKPYTVTYLDHSGQPTKLTDTFKSSLSALRHYRSSGINVIRVARG